MSVLLEARDVLAGDEHHRFLHGAQPRPGVGADGLEVAGDGAVHGCVVQLADVSIELGQLLRAALELVGVGEPIRLFRARELHVRLEVVDQQIDLVVIAHRAFLFLNCQNTATFANAHSSYHSRRSCVTPGIRPLTRAVNGYGMYE